MPLADPTLAYGPTWEECKLISPRTANPVRMLTILDTVWSQSPPLDPLLPDLPPSDSVVVEVSRSIVSSSVIRSRDFLEGRSS